ncbi:unnamed protein product [Amoebophrya sp. A25]|nr:unnamed protein product [Amoebophrya sp. A25]|eukprot:GSA25T00000854001.1
MQNQAATSFGGSMASNKQGRTKKPGFLDRVGAKYENLPDADLISTGGELNPSSGSGIVVPGGGAGALSTSSQKNGKIMSISSLPGRGRAAMPPDPHSRDSDDERARMLKVGTSSATSSTGPMSGMTSFFSSVGQSNGSTTLTRGLGLGSSSVGPSSTAGGVGRSTAASGGMGIGGGSSSSIGAAGGRGGGGASDFDFGNKLDTAALQSKLSSMYQNFSAQSKNFFATSSSSTGIGDSPDRPPDLEEGRSGGLGASSQYMNDTVSNASADTLANEFLAKPSFKGFTRFVNNEFSSFSQKAKVNSERVRDNMKNNLNNVIGNVREGGLGEQVRAAGSMASEKASKAAGAIKTGALNAREKVGNLSPPNMVSKTTMMNFLAVFLFGNFIMGLAFTIGLPVIAVAPQKFGMLFGLGSALTLASFGILRGWRAFSAHLVEEGRRKFAIAYVISFIGVFWAALFHPPMAYVWLLGFAIIEAVALAYFLVSYIPGGTRALTFIGNSMGKLCARFFGVSLSSSATAA